MSALPFFVGACPLVLFVTSNEDKLREVEQILNGIIPVLGWSSLDLPELQGADPIEIAVAKAIHARSLSTYPVLVEDTSLCFTALKELPGPYIKWFVQRLGLDGLVRLLAGHEDKTAYAQCIFVYMKEKDSQPIIFDGRCMGSIVSPRHSGNPGNDFGWDAVFQPLGSDKTFAEMGKGEKNLISHRAKALEMLKAHFVNNPIVLA